MSDENFIPSMTPVDDFMPRELYNPTAAAVWSIFLTPAFGEWCLRQNCKALDDDEGVFRSQSWFAGMIELYLFTCCCRLSPAINFCISHCILCGFSAVAARMNGCF